MEKGLILTEISPFNVWEINLSELSRKIKRAEEADKLTNLRYYVIKHTEIYN